MQEFITLPYVNGTDRKARMLDIAEVVALEQRIASEGTSLLELMTRAGSALSQAVEKATPNGRVVVLAGSGNNGGDGWVAAAKLVEAGRDVILVTKTTPAELNAEPARTAALDTFARGGFEVLMSPDRQELAEVLGDASVIVDAILGTGFAHDQVREPYSWWIQLANAARSEYGATIIAADCPSGLNAQTGTSASECIEVDVTVTMLAPKVGLLEPAAQSYVGSLVLAPLVEE